MTVRARDAAGNWSALSAPVSVSPAPDTFAPSAPGAVTTTNLTPTGFTVNWSAAIDDVAVTGYEIFVNGVSQGTAAANATSFNVTTLPAGGPPYVVTVRARDAAGNWSTASEPLSVTLNPLPFFTGFETTDSYTLGSLHGQNGWSVDGAAAVVTAPVYGGTQAIAVAPMANLSLVTRQFANANPGVTFVDVFARPAVSDNPDAGTFVETDEAAVALTGLAGTDSLGTFQVFDGDGSQGGSWTSANTGPALEVATGQVTAWQRLTIRTDYVAQRWDLFLNGRLIAANLGFLDNTSTRFTSLSLNGHATLATGFDDVFVGFDNPLFTDADKDGMDDTWETANGLNPAVNDRDSDLDGDGTSNLFEYLNGTGANIPNTPTDTDGDGLLDTWERQYFGDLRYSGTADPGGVGRSLLQSQQQGITPWPAAPLSTGLRGWYRADLGATPNPSSKVSQWTDLSGNGNHGAQTEPLYWPTSVPAQMNGRPVLRFNGANNYFNLPDMMAGATAGEIFVVARLKDFSNNYSGLVHFGTGFGTIYSGGGVWNDFGTNDEGFYARPTDAVVTQAHITNASISTSGESILRVNGVEHVRLTDKTVIFRPDPALGIDRYGEAFNGDIAEVLVFDRVLSGAEREQIGTYLTTKYAPPPITVPAQPVVSTQTLSSTTAAISWPSLTEGQHFVATVERQQGSGAFTVVASVSDATTFLDAGLSSGSTYTYRVKLTSYAGSSPYGLSATITSPTSDVLPATGLRLWLRADVASHSAAGAIDAWLDVSGRGFDARSRDTANRPLKVASAINGQATVRFDGSTQGFDLGNFMAGATAGEILVVMKSTQPAGANYEWSLGGDPNVRGTYYPDVDGVIRDDFGSTERQTTPAPSQSIDAYHIYNVSARSGQWTNRYNRSVIASLTANTVGFNSTPTLGYNQAGGFAGDIAEVIIYDRVLSAAQRESIVTYLNQKYSLQLGAPPAINDLDGDGMADDWEIANGLDPNVNDAAADLDGDGFTNLQEYQLGRNPMKGALPDSSGAVNLRVYSPNR
jgi:hypothetical protein